MTVSALLLRVSVIANVIFVTLSIVWIVRRYALARGSAAAEGLYARERRSVLAALPRREGGTVLLGDSLTERGEWTELLGDASVQNRGVAGDTTAGVLARAREAVAQKPARVLLLVGVNDLLAGEPASAVAERYARIVEALRAAAPQAKLYCQSVLPLREGEGAAPASNTAVRELNQAIARLSAERSCTYVDVFTAMVGPDGSLDASFTMDGVHLTGEGYAAWARALAPALAPRSPGEPPSLAPN